MHAVLQYTWQCIQIWRELWTLDSGLWTGLCMDSGLDSICEHTISVLEFEDILS